MADKRCILTRLKEHIAYRRRDDYDKSAIVKHSHSKDHVINWQEAKLIVPDNRWCPRRVREAIKIHKHDTVPQDVGFHISRIWHSLLTSQTNWSSIPAVTSSPQTNGSPKPTVPELVEMIQEPL